MKMNELEKVGEVLQYLEGIDHTILTVVLALLPDVQEDGARPVIGAAARIIAERYDDTEQTLNMFKDLVMQHKKEIKEAEQTTD